MNNIAQGGIPIAPGGAFKGLPGSGALENPGGNSPMVLANIISTSIGLMTIIAIIWFVFIFISGAIGIMTSGADKGANEAAKKRITSGLTGLVIVIIAIFVVDLLGYLLGIPDILNVGLLFMSLVPKVM